MLPSSIQDCVHPELMDARLSARCVRGFRRLLRCMFGRDDMCAVQQFILGMVMLVFICALMAMLLPVILLGPAPPPAAAVPLPPAVSIPITPAPVARLLRGAAAMAAAAVDPVAG